jgi:hypothetical protein
MQARRPWPGDAREELSEPLAVLLLPAKLENYDFAAHARDLLQIPRVLALEPGRFKTPRWLRETAPARSAKHLRFPGEPRVLVLYHPRQYPLARALGARYGSAELWYMRPDPDQLLAGDPTEDLTDLDQLASERATPARVISQTAEPAQLREPLRLRLRELGIISARVFVPGARVQAR